MVIIETPRLLLRQWQTADLDPYAALFANPRVTQHTRPIPRERIEAFAESFLRQWHEHSFGPFAAIEKSTGRWVGQIGLNRLDELPRPDNVEVGFELLPEFWGQGLATEGARACLRFGFEEVGLERIISVTNPANAPSRRVLEKAGFIYQGLREYHGHESAWYALDRAAWRARAEAGS